MDALAAIPEDCKGESICSFLKDKLGPGATVGLAGSLSADGMALQAVLKVKGCLKVINPSQQVLTFSLTHTRTPKRGLWTRNLAYTLSCKKKCK